MVSEKCRAWFSPKDPAVPSEYSALFEELARRAGDPAYVESCDLEGFYRDQETAATYRFLQKSDFLEQVKNPAGQVQLRFAYGALFAHVLRIKHEKHFPTTRDLIRIHTQEGHPEKIERLQATRVLQQLTSQREAEQLAPAFLPALKALYAQYPYRLTNIDGKGDVPVGSFWGVSLDSRWACGGFACVPLTQSRVLYLPFDDRRPKGGVYFVMESDAQWKNTLQAIDVHSGKELWWLTCDFSFLLQSDENPFGIPAHLYRLSESSEVASKQWWARIPTPIATSITRAQWEDFLRLLPSDFELFSKSPIRERIEAQIPK
ncbi:MAG: hypothetical protein HYV03_03510 [Deltaproteobacteria bacterium]|nr:hypothetical protein [Deltaproteobacteria bacterium]